MLVLSMHCKTERSIRMTAGIMHSATMKKNRHGGYPAISAEISVPIIWEVRIRDFPVTTDVWSVHFSRG